MFCGCKLSAMGIMWKKQNKTILLSLTSRTQSPTHCTPKKFPGNILLEGPEYSTDSSNTRNNSMT